MPTLTATLLAATLSATPAAPPARLGLCEACHGRDGRGRTEDTPHIGGQQQAYLREALQQYRDGRRKAAAMAAIAPMLRPADIDALARWYAAQPWPSDDVPAAR